MLTWIQIQAFLGPLVAGLEPMIMNEETTLNSDLKALIAQKVASPDLQAALTALDSALDAFAKIEIQKL